MSDAEKNENLTVQGDSHAPAPPADGVRTLGDSHAPAPGNG